VVGVEMNGRPLPFKVQSNDGGENEDQHVSVRFPAHVGSNRVVIRVKNDFGLSLSNELPPLGSTSRELRVLSESWNPARTQLTVEISGVPGMRYELEVWNPSQLSSIDGAVLSEGKIHFEVPETGEGAGADYQHRTIIFHFGEP
jgi:hypothetical protein